MNKTKKSIPLTAELLNLANQGNLFLGQGKFEDAIKVYRKVLAVKPDFAEVYNNMGVALQQQGKLDAAAECYQQALLINPAYPDAHQNLGLVCKDQGKLEIAIDYFYQALRLRPNYADTYCNLGITFKALGNLDAAIESYQKALSIDPNLTEAHFNLGFSLLCSGQFTQGWQQHEIRHNLQLRKQNSISLPNVSFPQWQGESIAGKSLLIWHEQGLGDEIQFCRYVSVLKNQGVMHITWVCKKPLQSLFLSLKEVDAVVTEKEAGLIRAHDYWTLALSIPFHCKTTLETIPASVPYLYGKPKLIKKIAANLGQMTHFKVGICWKGNTAHKNDKNRSPGIERFKPLFKLAGVKFFTLQPGTRSEFIAATGTAGVDIGHEIDATNFEEATALIMNLDLVISCDTSIAHLVGALGKPVWLVLPFDPDWRWLLQREDSPWYPSARLFRQTQRDDWDSVFVRVEHQLKECISQSR
jgi:Tfp pilus assembly protein PilF